MRVLVVDDEGALLRTITANLELDGFEVVAAEGAARALEIAARETFDLVLTDIRMPGMDGVELFRRIRALRPEMPVVLMTAFAMEGLVDDALSEGAFAVLPKPFAMEDVVATLTRAARRPVVLLVDGSEAEAAAVALREGGVPAEAATGEASAVSAMERGRADVCVVPLVNDTTLAWAARLRAMDPSLVLVAIAGELAPSLGRRLAALGAFACLPPPVSPKALARVIGLARGARRPSLQAAAPR